MYVLTVVGPEQRILVKMSQLVNSIELLFTIIFMTKVLIARLEILLMLADINRIHF